jgi:hypothetical protein
MVMQRKYYEASHRGVLFAACEQGTGVAPGTTAALVLYNLQGSGKRLSIKKVASGWVTKDTKVVMGKYNEKEKEWEASGAITYGLFGDIFKDLGAKTVYVRLTFRDGDKGISLILVSQIGKKK